MMLGTLYAVGVGPGAPDLLTLRAARVLGRARVILAAASPRNEASSALEAARPHLNAEARIVRLDFPMTRDRATLEKAWHAAATTCLEVLESGEDAVFLTIGDPLIYSTFGYLLGAARRMAPEIPVQIIPGITSFQAAAATETILCEGEENLLILSGIRREAELAAALAAADTVAVLKAYRNFPAIVAALASTGRSGDAVLASHVERPDARLLRGVEDAELEPPYMSLVLTRRPG